MRRTPLGARAPAEQARQPPDRIAQRFGDHRMATCTIGRHLERVAAVGPGGGSACHHSCGARSAFRERLGVAGKRCADWKIRFKR